MPRQIKTIQSDRLDLIARREFPNANVIQAMEHIIELNPGFFVPIRDIAENTVVIVPDTIVPYVYGTG